MDPATLTLIVGLSGGAFLCLALLYITTPYPTPNDIDSRIPEDFWSESLVDVDGPQAEERWAA